ncbi:MAG: Ras family protein [Promethearchaeota archaeon CR_4]|nr:MAG: Ras family protein [Candidatus Lokiarchaeota archaeon CR_4]
MSNSGRSFDADYIFKVAVVGDGAVGKTSLILRYTQGSFNTNYIRTIGAQFSKYDLTAKTGEKVRLFLWDIAGQDSFTFMRPTFFSGSKTCIAVFDVTNENTFTNLQTWIDDIHKYCGTDIPVVLFGNKVDLVNDKYANPKIEAFLKANNVIGFYLTSAKTGTNVTQAFEAIINELLKLVSTK